MKRSMIALAALGAVAGAAQAQSSVTLYGRVDANVTYSKPGDLVNSGDARWRMDDGGDNSGWGGSRWGLRGSEDLGSGLKANFLLESGFRSDTGGPGDTTRLFNRAAWVGLSSASAGEVRLGRQDTITRSVNLVADVSGFGELKTTENIQTGVAGTGFRPLFQTFGERVDNSASYTSPSFGGFQVKALVGAGEGTAARYQGIMGSYSAGPLNVALGYNDYAKFGARTSRFNKITNLGANYNFGFLTLFAGYQNTKDAGTATGAALTPVSIRDEKAANIGVMVPVGAFQILGQFTYAKYDLAGGGDAKAKKYGAAVRYALSKRTSLYSAITRRDGETTIGAVTTDDDNSFTQKTEFTLLGLAHTF